jgi:hypothetical protein
MADLAGFSRNNAEIILETVRYLRANGFILPKGARGQRTAAATPIYVRNDSGEEIPAYACLQTTGTVEEGGQNFITVDKPVDASGAAGSYLFNGQEPIAASGEQSYGIAHDGPLCRMLTDGATLSSGDKCRPVVGEWYIELGGNLITIVGDDDIEPDTVRGMIGASGGGGEDWGVIIKTPVGGIAQRTGTTVSSASCDVFSIVGSTLTDTTENIDVFNISLGAVAGEIFGTAKREYATGKWIIDLEDCT